MSAKNKKITQRIVIVVVVICIATLVYYIWRDTALESVRSSQPAPYAEPGVMYGVNITKQAGEAVMTIKAATTRPKGVSAQPNIIKHLMDDSSGYEIELRRVDMSIRDDGRLLELKSEKAYTNPDFMDIEFKGLKITANEGYDLHPDITALKVSVRDSKIEVGPVR